MTGCLRGQPCPSPRQQTARPVEASQQPPAQGSRGPCWSRPQASPATLPGHRPVDRWLLETARASAPQSAQAAGSPRGLAAQPPVLRSSCGLGPECHPAQCPRWTESFLSRTKFIPPSQALRRWKAPPRTHSASDEPRGWVWGRWGAWAPTQPTRLHCALDPNRIWGLALL